MDPPIAISENINGEKPSILLEPEIDVSTSATAQPSASTFLPNSVDGQLSMSS